MDKREKRKVYVIIFYALVKSSLTLNERINNMCGIFGIDLTQCNISRNKKLVLTTLLSHYNATRGDQSYGIFDHMLFKTVKGTSSIVKKIYFLNTLDLYFAHTRYATHGIINATNAHPFEIGDIIGAHNGVLSNHKDLNTKYNRNFEVDSMHLFAHLNENKPLDDIEGYGAIEWVNKKDPNKIFLCKLAGGSLSIAEVQDKKGKKGIVWSSDRDHLTSSLRSARIRFTLYKIESEVIYFVQNGVLYITEEKLSLKEKSKIVDWKQGYNGSLANSLDNSKEDYSQWFKDEKYDDMSYWGENDYEHDRNEDYIKRTRNKYGKSHNDMLMDFDNDESEEFLRLMKEA
jgi:hypothetical protein